MPSDEDGYSQNSTACVDGHRAAAQEKDTVHVKPSTWRKERERERSSFQPNMKSFARRRQPSSGDNALHAQHAEGRRGMAWKPLETRPHRRERCPRGRGASVSSHRTVQAR